MNLGHAISQTTAVTSFVFAFSRHPSVFVVVLPLPGREMSIVTRNTCKVEAA